MKCPKHELLLLGILGQLSAEKARSIERHERTCADCHRRSQAYASLLADLATPPRLPSSEGEFAASVMRRCEAAEPHAVCAPVSRRPHRHGVLLSLAAACALLVVSGGLVPERPSTSYREPEGEPLQRTTVESSRRPAGRGAERAQTDEDSQWAKAEAGASESTPQSVVATLHSLAARYVSLGEYAAAEALYQRSLAIQEQRLGASRDELASSLDRLAALYLKQRRYVQAEALYERSLAIKREVLGPEHPEVTSRLASLKVLLSLTTEA